MFKVMAKFKLICLPFSYVKVYIRKGNTQKVKRKKKITNDHHTEENKIKENKYFSHVF